jgi:sigma-B regulation protein RsbU (phosphoserine phosphatase)
MYEMSTDEDSAIFTSAGLRFLLIEDSASDAHVAKVHLKKGLDVPVSVEHVESLAAAIETLDRHTFDLVLLDLTLLDSTGLDTFHAVFAHSSGRPILILSGHEDSELAVIAVREGAQDYILKGELSGHALSREVRFAMERNKRVTVERQLESVEEQMRIARKLQKSLYPRTAPTLDGFDISGRAWAAEHACGDYFDFLPMLHGAVGVVVGDVSGHGLGPALKMVETRAALQAYCDYEDNLSKLIAGVHRVFCGGQPFAERGLFLTLFLGRLDVSNRILHYSSAGHPAYHLTAAGDYHATEAMDYPIGLVDEMSGEGDRQVLLKSGDVFVIPTDGFYEAGARGKDLYGVDRMMTVVRNNRHRSAQEIVRAMYNASRHHTSNMDQEDDMAAIVIKVT